jgi:transglutaminase-like putative cysteine protease
LAALPTRSSEPAGPRLPWLPSPAEAVEAQPGRAEDRWAADLVGSLCAVALVALVLGTLPGFLAMHGPWPDEAGALAVGAAFGYLSTGGHPMTRQARWYLTLGIWAAAAAAFAVAFWRDPAVRALAATWVSDARYLAEAWAAGSTPPVPELAGWPLLLGLAWAIGAFVWRCLRTRAPLPAVAGMVGLLVLEWEFLDDTAGRIFWPAVAAGLLWLAAAWAYQLAERAWVARPPAAVRVVGLAAAGIALMVGVVALLPLNRPALDLGALGYWIDATFPTLAHMEQGTRLTPAAGQGNGPTRNPGAPGPLAPANPYSMKMVGFSANDGELGGPLATSDRPALHVTVVSGSAPSILYIRGAADDTYTGRGWTESKESLYPAAPPRAPAAFTFGAGNPLPPRDSYTLRVQPVGVVTDTLFTALTPAAVQGARPVWDRLGNAWLANPLPPNASYEVSAVAIPTPTSAPAAAAGTPDSAQLAEGSLLHEGQARQDSQGPCFGCAAGAQTLPPGLGGGRLSRSAFAADLQLPAGLPAEVRQLAQRWTAGDATPLAEALDIQNRLLQIPYSMNAPAPAPGTDFVDQFLFHIRQGYCTYYASAMAVMLRTLDIPSRWVVGFRVHTPAAGQTLTVTDADAHAWVEAFIPPYGWLVFDPTPWGPTLAPPTPAGPSGVAGGSVSPGGDQAPTAVDLLRGPLADLLGEGPAGSTGSVPIPRSLLLIPLAALLAVAAAFAWSAYRDRWNPADPVGSAERCWSALERVAARRGRPRARDVTPAEFARDLDQRWPGLQGQAAALAEAYGGLVWGPPGKRADAALRVRAAWEAIDRIWTAEAPVRHRLRRLL